MAEFTTRHIFLVGEYRQSSKAKALDAYRIMSAVFPEYAIEVVNVGTFISSWAVRLWSQHNPDGPSEDRRLASELPNRVAAALKLALG